MKRAGVCLRVLLLAVAVCWTIGTRAQESERRVALVIGNAGYQHVDRLANPGNDAKLIADTLRRSGFTLVGGGAQRDLDKAAFDRLVREFGQQIQGAEVALFYYAGHGIQVQGSNWLLPVDANPTRPQDFDFQLVNAELVLKQMDGAGTRLNIVLLDACRNNPFANLGTRGIGSGLAQMRAPEGTLISFATQPGNVAVDGTGADGPYATALADAIRQPGLDIFHLFNQVGLRVKRDTQGSQQPWVSSSPIDGDFYFAHSEAAPDVMGVPMLETPPSVQAGASRDAAGGAKPAPAQTADTDRPLRDLAEKGQPQAQTDLGLLYAKGFGVEKDYATAMQWFQRAAGQGSPRAQYYIGMMYERGYGVPRSYDTALDWYRRAAAKDFPLAEIAMARFYGRGLVVERDPAQRATWLLRAAGQGQPAGAVHPGQHLPAGPGRAAGPCRRGAMVSARGAPGLRAGRDAAWPDVRTWQRRAAGRCPGRAHAAPGGREGECGRAERAGHDVSARPGHEAGLRAGAALAAGVGRAGQHPGCAQSGHPVCRWPRCAARPGGGAEVVREGGSVRQRGRGRTTGAA